MFFAATRDRQARLARRGPENGVPEREQLSTALHFLHRELLRVSTPLPRADNWHEGNFRTAIWTIRNCTPALGRAVYQTIGILVQESKVIRQDRDAGTTFILRVALSRAMIYSYRSATMGST